MRPDQAEFLRDFYTTSFKKEHPITRRVIEAIPEDRADYRPNDVVKSAIDLAWHIVLAEHRFLEREGNDLRMRLPLTLTEAALGAQVSVPTPDGTATIKIPPGTPAGRRIRLAGKGVPSARNGERGDLYVEIAIQVPIQVATGRSAISS